jgi:membrane protein YdbS with pleckstrin-like domain
MNGVVDMSVFHPGDATPSANRIDIKPSQAFYLGYFVQSTCLAALWFAIYQWLAVRWNAPLSVLLVPVLLLAARVGWLALYLACMSYTLEGERIIWRRGILSRETGSLELFRVQNVGMSQTLFQRIAGVGNVTLLTQDPTNPFLCLLGMKRPEELRDWINDYIMRQRRAHGFQEIVVN